MEVPEGGEELLSVFWTLSGYRDQGFNGPLPIRPRDIRDWCEVTGNILTRDEIATLMAMDGAFMEAAAKERAEAQKSSRDPSS